QAARGLALVRTDRGLVLAALDARDAFISLYARQPDSRFAQTQEPKVPGTLPVLLAVGDLNGDGRDDLVAVTAGSPQAFVYLHNAAGRFGPTPAYQNAVGVSPSDIQLADVDGDGRLDIVVTNRYSSDVSILLNSAGTPFDTALRFRASTGLCGVDTL